MSIEDHKFIVFCQDHYNPLTLIRSLGIEGIRPVVILVAERPFMVNHSKYNGPLHQVVTIEAGYDLLVREYGNEIHKPFLFTASDDIESYLDNHYSELYDRFIFFDGGDEGRINRFMDKEAISLLAQQIGFRIPKAEVVPKGELPQDIPYPVMTKAINSTASNWKDDVFICQTPQELEDAYVHIRSNPVLVEEFIQKKNELCVDGISIRGGEEVYMPYKVHYIRMTDKAYGNYMEVFPFDDELLKQKISELIKATGFSGIFSIEFLVTDDNDLVFLEINFRHSTWAITSLYGGANLPVLWAEGMLSGTIPAGDLILRKKPFKAMSELADFNDSVRSGKISVFQWLNDFHHCECTFLYDKKDKGPVVSVIKRLASRFFSHRILGKK